MNKFKLWYAPLLIRLLDWAAEGQDLSIDEQMAGSKLRKDLTDMIRNSGGLIA